MRQRTVRRKPADPQSRLARELARELSQGRAGAAGWSAGSVPAAGGAVPVRLYRPAGASRGWLVWAHGGSWHAGSLEGWHRPCLSLAETAQVTVVSVGYRLAPRHPHPAPLHDVLTVLDWARRRAAAEGLGDHLAVGGDSAGATVAACAAVRCRDLGRPLSAQVLAYPPMDPQCRARSYRARPGAFPDAASLRTAWQLHRGRHGDGGTLAPYSTPMEARTLEGVAPALLAVGALDPVVDDVWWYHDQLLAWRVPVRMYEQPGTGHGAFLTAEPEQPGPGRGPSLRAWLATALHHEWEQR